jgi:hypothetical protein
MAIEDGRNLLCAKSLQWWAAREGLETISRLLLNLSSAYISSTNTPSLSSTTCVLSCQSRNPTYLAYLDLPPLRDPPHILVELIMESRELRLGT